MGINKFMSSESALIDLSNDVASISIHNISKKISYFNDVCLFISNSQRMYTQSNRKSLLTGIMFLEAQLSVLI